MRSRRALLLLALLPVLAACSSSASIRDGGRVAGDTLTVYSSLPSPTTGSGADIVAGEKLALAERRGHAGAYDVTFTSAGEPALGPRGAVEPVALATEDIIRDTQVIAVIGATRAAETRVTAPLLNAAGILQVGLGAGEPAGGRSDAATPTGRPSLGTLAGDERQEAAVLAAAAADPTPRSLSAAAAARTRGSGTVAVEAEAGADTARLAAATRAAVAAAGMRLVRTEAAADTIVLLADDPADGRALLAAVARDAPRARIVLPDALTRAGVAAGLPARIARRTRAVAAAPAPPPGFAARFRAAYGRDPGPYAAAGFRAMGAVLDAVAAAGPRAGSRQAVIDAFMDGRAETGGAPGAVFTILRGG
jgi:branched-chain amino acid transport system substrate-binding protein